MARLGISEFTFGFAFLYEEATKNRGKLVAAPVLPSLQEEAKKGWNAKLPTVGTDFYYQFKLSEYLTRSNAKFRHDGTYKGPYFRFSFHRHASNQQHRRLRQHAKQHEHTYYVAPEFRTFDEFNAHFLNGSIVSKSRLIPVKECKDIDPADSSEHVITFESGDQTFLQHSLPHQGTWSIGGEGIEWLYRRSEDKWRPIDDAWAIRLYNHAWEMAGGIREEDDASNGKTGATLPLPFDRISGEEDKSTILLETSNLLAAYFGITMVLVGRKE